jgi:hypothetical protein
MPMLRLERAAPRKNVLQYAMKSGALYDAPFFTVLFFMMTFKKLEINI